MGLAWGASPGVAQQQAEPDAATCALCHGEQAEEVPADPHGVLGETAAFGSGGGTCVSCHRGGAEHVDVGGGRGNILAFGADGPTTAGADACLSCHTSDHPRFMAGEHAQAGIACADCHRVHQDAYDRGAILELADALAAADPAGGLDPASSLCVQCHGDVGARFEMNERHRLDEGSLGCTSCHDPHDREAAARLGGFGGEETCLQCHVSQAGPFVFEHEASRVEGCIACHDPHGSPNRHLLDFQDQGQLCYSCHVELPGFHLGDPVRFGPEANCTNCHTTIHGSNFDRDFLR